MISKISRTLIGLLWFCLALPSFAQTPFVGSRVYLGTQDFTGATATKPFHSLSSDPTLTSQPPNNCIANDVAMNPNTTHIFICTGSGNTWVAFVGSGGGSSSTPYGPILVTAQSSVTITAATHGQGTTPLAFCFDSVTTPRNLVSCAWQVINSSGDVTFTFSPPFTGSYMIYSGAGGGSGGSGGTLIIDGDISGSGANNGTIALTLPTVNSSVGSCGSSTQICIPVLNAKGLVTGASTVAIGAPQGAETVSFSTTPTFSASLRASIITLTGNITSFTMPAGNNGQQKVLTFVQGSGNWTVSPPSNIHGFFTIGSTNGGYNTQTFTYYTTPAVWVAETPGVTNK